MKSPGHRKRSISTSPADRRRFPRLGPGRRHCLTPALALTLIGLCVLVGVEAGENAAGLPPSAPALAPPAEVTFMAYNVKNYLRMPRRVDGEPRDRAPKPEPEIQSVLKLILKASPDVLGLVEIGDTQDLADLQSRLDEAGLDLPHATLAEAFDDDRRVALLSRFPIAATAHQTALSFPLGSRRFPFRRGILDATIQVHADYQMRALGVHLKSKRDVAQADQALIRRHEAHLTRQHVTAILREAPETNVLLFGDFNDTPDSPSIKAIQGRRGSLGYLQDLSLADDLGYRWTYFWSYADQYSRFDYLFVNRALRSEILAKECFIVSDPAWYQASDHRPIVATFRPHHG